MMRTILVLLLMLLLGVTISAAQEAANTCDVFVEQAMTALDSTCGGMDRNSACYGYNLLQAAFYETISPDVFDTPDDRIQLASLRQIQTAPLNPDSGEWGIAVMKVQANIPDTLPGQAVTFLLMGDAQIENAVEPGSEQQPMQAIYFRTGITGTTCAEAPEPSLVVQSPENLTVNLTVNGADISIGSTAVLTTIPGEDDPTETDMEITVVDGRVTLPDGRVLPGGFWSRAELDENGRFVPGQGFREINTMTDIAIDAAEQFQRLPRNLLAYPIDPPTLEQVEMLGALDLGFVQAFDPDLLRPLANALITVGAAPDDVRGFGRAELRRYLLPRLSALPPTPPAELDEETLQRLREAFTAAD